MQHLKKIFTEIFNNQIDFSTPADQIEEAQPSESTQHLLSAYIEAELDEKNAADLFPDVQAALAKFPEFAEEHKILYELLDAERRGELEEPPFIPEFDFSYLMLQIEPEKEPVAQSNLISTVPWVINKIGHLVIQFTDQVVEAMHANQLQMAPTRSLKSEESWKTWLEYKLPRPTSNLDVIVSFRHTGKEKDYCNVVVNVDVPSQGGWPNLAGSQVQVTGPELEREWQETDPFGEVIFKCIDKALVPHLTFEVNPVAS